MEIRFNKTVEFRARLKDKDGGGWKGDPEYIGLVNISETADSRIVFGKTSIASLQKQFDAADYERTVLAVQLVDHALYFTLGADDGVNVRFAIEAHRDDFHLVLAASSPVHQSAETGPVVQPGDIETELNGPTADFMEGPADYQAVNTFAPLLGGQASVVKRTESSPVSRGMALAMVRRAVQNPGLLVAYGPMPEWLPDPKAIRRDVGRLLRATGLADCASLGNVGFTVDKPLGTDETYKWTQGIERFIGPVESFQIKARATARSTGLDPVMAEALALTTKVMGLDADKPWIK
jgi:hypothetical protein